MRISGWLVLVLLFAAPAGADQSYSVAVSDDRAAALADRTKTTNLMRARAAKGVAAPADLTPAQVLQRAVDDVLDQWDAQLMASENGKPFSERSPRAKRKHCEQHGIKDCPK